jgi:uncharacterized protein involved in cysteine biosynthesis
MVGGNMSRYVLGILGAALIAAGIIGLVGHSAGWVAYVMPSWLAWLEILVGIIILVVAASDTKNYQD